MSSGSCSAHPLAPLCLAAALSRGLSYITSVGGYIHSSASSKTALITWVNPKDGTSRYVTTLTKSGRVWAGSSGVVGEYSDVNFSLKPAGRGADEFTFNLTAQFKQPSKTVTCQAQIGVRAPRAGVGTHAQHPTMPRPCPFCAVGWSHSG